MCEPIVLAPEGFVLHFECCFGDAMVLSVVGWVGRLVIQVTGVVIGGGIGCAYIHGQPIMNIGMPIELAKQTRIGEVTF